MGRSSDHGRAGADRGATPVAGQPKAEWNPDRVALYAAQDDCLIAIEDGRPLPVAALKQMPPWRAVMVARIAAKAGVGLKQGTVGQMVAEAVAVGGSGELGDWWQRAEEAEDRV